MGNENCENINTSSSSNEDVIDNGINHKEINSFDSFHCGNCGQTFYSLELFFKHKIEQDSMSINYVGIKLTDGTLTSIPTLKKNDEQVNNEEIKNKEDINHNDRHCNDSSERCEELNVEVSNEERKNCQEIIKNDEKQRENPVVTVIFKGKEEKKFYNCKDCNKMFSQKSRAIRHLESVHNWNMKRTETEQEKIQDGKQSLNLEKVPPSMKQIKCEVCGALIKGKRALKVHQLTHTEERTFRCPFNGCSFAFKTKGSLQRHNRRHTGERPFKCNLCGRNFRESGALTRHLKSRFLCVTKTDSDLPNYGKERALPCDDPNLTQIQQRNLKVKSFKAKK